MGRHGAAVTEGEAARMVEMWRRGDTVNAISAATGWSAKTVSKKLHDAGARLLEGKLTYVCATIGCEATVARESKSTVCRECYLARKAAERASAAIAMRGTVTMGQPCPIAPFAARLASLSVERAMILAMKAAKVPL